MEQLKYPPKEAVTRARLASERSSFDAILQDEKLGKLAREAARAEAAEANRRRLLASALRITERIIPSLVKLVAAAQRITHFEDAHVETYVHNDPRQNAACMYFEDGGLFLLISSGLFDAFDDRQLLFVVGHELAHAIYGHHRLPARAILAQDRSCGAREALRLMSWARQAEISADRVGLLCCQDLDVATKSLIKLSCGLGEAHIQFDLGGYLSQMADIQAISELVRDTQDFYASHPFNPLRVVAMSHFWDSRMLAELLGHSPGKLTDEEVDRKIDEALGVMEPPPGQSDPPQVIQCLLWGGYWVAAADGTIDTVESRAIGEVTGEQAARDALAEIRSAADPPTLIQERFQRAAAACRNMPASDRHVLVQKLVAVAKADLDVAQEEILALRRICEAIDISPAFVDQVLSLFD